MLFGFSPHLSREELKMYLIVLILVILCLVGGLPTWGYHHYGYAPSGILFAVLIIVLLFWLLGRGGPI